MLCARRYGQLSRRVSNCACRDFFWICASSKPKLPQITQNHTDLGKTETADLQKKAARASASRGARDARTNLSRAAHVGACTGVDLDRLAFLDKKRHVNGLAGFQLCRLRDVTRSIAPQTFR